MQLALGSGGEEKAEAARTTFSSESVGGYLQQMQSTFAATAEGHLGPEEAKRETERVAKLLSDAHAILEQITGRGKELEDQVAKAREAQRLQTLAALDRKDDLPAAGVLAAKLAEQGIAELPHQGATQPENGAGAGGSSGPAGGKRKPGGVITDDEVINPAKYVCVPEDGDGDADM